MTERRTERYGPARVVRLLAALWVCGLMLIALVPNDVAAQQTPANQAEQFQKAGKNADGTTDFDESMAFDMLEVECWSCQFVSVFLYAGDAFARESFSVIGNALVGGLGTTAGHSAMGGSYGLLTWFFILWITLQATKLFFPDMTEGPGQVVKALAIRSLLFVIIVSVLSSGSAFFSYGPYLALGTGGSTAMALSDRFDSFTADDSVLDQTAGECGAGYRFGNNADLDSVGFGIEGVDKHFFGSEGQSLGRDDGLKGVFCLIHRMQAMSAVGITLSLYMISQGPFHDNGDTGWWIFGDIAATIADVFFILIGALLMAIVFGIGLVAVPFYFIDILIRMFLVAAFGPFLLAGAMFRPTRGMFWTGVKLVFGAMMNLIGLSMVYGLSTTMMRLAPNFVRSDDGGTYSSTQSFLEGLSNAEVAGSFGLANTGYWMFMMAGILLLLLLKKVSSLVSGVFGDNTNFGTNMGTSAARLAKTGITGAAMLTGLAAGKATAMGAKGVGGAVSMANDSVGQQGAAYGAGARIGTLMSKMGGRSAGNLEE